MKTILIIDGQGGGFGKALIEKLRQQKLPSAQILAVGTNSIATSGMLKAGADLAATGENPVIVNAARADIIAGPMGIVLANSMLGEVTPAMAAAVSESSAERVLIPVARCATHIAGVGEQPLSALMDDAASLIRQLLA
jgi:hypothetical protein